MAQICVLDKHTAELIAAGEVVERPSSVVKELLENAIDAKAKNVTVAIEHGGISMIQISDDGTGIEAESIPTAFLRHATSKIQTEDDLENIHTLGFRGEALASIASVSRVELLTKTEQDEYAYCYRISGGEEEGIEPAARPQGTTITVRDLFYNTPARMKFLKKDTSEGNYVSDVVSQLALSHPEISFKFLREGKIQFQTPGDGKLLSAAYAVLSREFAKDLLSVGYVHENYQVDGLVTPPKNGRASRSMQYFFINGRFVKNRTMMAALEAAYKGVLMQGRFPGCVLNVHMPVQLVDVNVHPAKTEVRFAREKDVFDVIYAAVKSILLTPQSSSKTLSFDEVSHSHPNSEPKAVQPAAQKSV
ncbi:DNA mismatch repair endonuclease MutL, partial [uncultured Ruthenibacterium sp.]|uniref:DNA mismatch repair endonuclease MutL n=1 Tax=uncultured Ruthenibacterium sp. TaxID=1905347 RepID=UPI00349E5646